MATFVASVWLECVAWGASDTHRGPSEEELVELDPGLVEPGTVEGRLGLPDLWSQPDTPPPAGVRYTGRASDLAVVGSGWFLLRDPATNELLATDHGAFSDWAPDHCIFDQLGMRLQGLSRVSGERVDLVIDRSGMESHAPFGSVSDFRIDEEGYLIAKLEDGTEVQGDRILLAQLPQPDRLEPDGPRRYLLLTPPEVGLPGSPGFGLIYSGGLGRQATPSIPARMTRAGPNVPGLQIVTGVATDWALAAPGFFLLRDPETGRYLVTRAGLFVANSEGRLVSYEGFCVQGWPMEGGKPNDIHVPSALTRLEQSPPKIVFSVSSDGTLFSYDSFADRHLEGRLAVVALPEATPLRQATSSCYHYPAQLGLPTSDRAVASPRVQVGRLEASAITAELAAKRRELKFIVQGAVMVTGFKADLAIDGSGFFLLRDPVAGRLYASRAGVFEWDDEGYLVTSKVRFYPSQSITVWRDDSDSLVMSTLPGLRLQGYCGPGSLVVGDLRVEPGWIGPGWDVRIRDDGEMRRRSPEGEEVVCGQILLQLFGAPERLQRAVLASGEISRIVYTDLEGAGPASSLVAPRSNGAGSLRLGAIEIIPPDDRPVQPVDLREPAFAIRGQPQSRYTIESSTDLRSWVAVAECETDTYGQALVLVCSIANPSHQPGAFASWYHTLAGPSLPWLPMPGFDSGYYYSPNPRPASFGMVYSGQPSAVFRLRLTH